MFKKIIVFIIFIYASVVYAKDDIGCKPLVIDNNSSVFCEEINDVNYPLAFYLESGGVKSKVDAYEENGDKPKAESMFLIDLLGVRNIIVLISWHQLHRAENINGYMYKIYGYTYTNGGIKKNKKINDDPNLSGQEGKFNNEQLYFKYKDSESITKYLKEKFK